MTPDYEYQRSLPAAANLHRHHRRHSSQAPPAPLRAASSKSHPCQPATSAPTSKPLACSDRASLVLLIGLISDFGTAHCTSAGHLAEPFSPGRRSSQPLRFTALPRLTEDFAASPHLVPTHCELCGTQFRLTGTITGPGKKLQDSSVSTSGLGGSDVATSTATYKNYKKHFQKDMSALGFEHSGTTSDDENPKSHYQDMLGKLTYIRLSDMNCRA